MADVFISYSQQVPEPTVAVAAALTERGFRPWYDVNLLPGQFFGAVIDDAIDRAQAVVTIWSPQAIASQWVPAESARALSQKKLICVRTPEVEPKKLPTPFHTLHVPLWTELDSIFQALVSLGARPSGLAGQTDLDALAANAARDWKLLKAHDAGHEEIEAFIAEYGALAMYRRMGEARLKTLGPTAPTTSAPAQPAPVLPAPPPVSADDVILRIDSGMHTVSISRIGVSADGRLMATGSGDKTVRLWALPEGKLIRTLRPPIGDGNEGKVYAVALDPAGRWVAAGGWTTKRGIDGHVTLFDAETGALIARLGPLPNVVRHLAISSDGRWLAAGIGGKNGVRVWDVSPSPRGEGAGGRGATPSAGASPHPLPPPLAGRGGIALEGDYTGDVYGIAFSADATRLATTCYDGHVRLYHLSGDNWASLRKAKAPSGAEPYGIAFCPDGARLAIGYEDAPRVDLFDAAALAPLPAPDCADLSGGNLMSVAFLADGRLAAGGAHQTQQDGAWRCPVFVWDAARRRNAWPGPENSIMDLAVLRASEVGASGGLVFGASDPAFGVLDAGGAKQLWRGPAAADLRSKVREHFLASTEGARLRFGLKSFSAHPVLFDLKARRLERAPAAPADLRQADTRKLKIEGWENGTAPKLTIKKLVGEELKRLALEQYERSRALAIAPDAKSFVLGADWSLRCFSADGAQIWKKPVPGVCWGVNLARDGKLILAAYGDGTIRWHRASDGEELLALFIHVTPDFDYANAEQGERTLSGLDWIAFTPKGFYDASSPAAEKLIGWHVNRGPDEAADFYPAETFASAFKKPAIIDAAFDQL